MEATIRIKAQSQFIGSMALGASTISTSETFARVFEITEQNAAVNNPTFNLIPIGSKVHLFIDILLNFRSFQNLKIGCFKEFLFLLNKFQTNGLQGSSKACKSLDFNNQNI